MYQGQHHKYITLNGQGRSGKTTIAKRLAGEGYGAFVNLYGFRDKFFDDIYSHLERTEHQQDKEVLGVGTLAWVIAQFYKDTIYFVDPEEVLILDHYILDYVVQILPDLPPSSFDMINNFLFYCQMPRMNRSLHFYLDIDYDTYLSRTERKDLDGETDLVELRDVPYDIFEDRRSRYLEYCELHEHVLKVDAMCSEDDTYNTILDRFKKRYNVTYMNYGD